MEHETRLIDANALIEKIQFRIPVMSQETKIVNDCVLMTRKAIREAPTVDAVEVVHAEWGEIYTCHGERLWGYKCSRCEQDNAKESNYCPNCGAKMDGGNEDG